MSELKRTPLHAAHLEAGARMAPFAGWHMPVNYGSQIDEHHAVRRSAGMFDVSHMAIVDAAGPGAKPYLRRLLANDVAKRGRKRGRADCTALYSCMLDGRGGILDDLIVYRFADDRYRLIVNAGTREKDLAWLSDQAAGFDVGLTERDDLAMIAVQGPEARGTVAALFRGGAPIGTLSLLSSSPSSTAAGASALPAHIEELRPFTAARAGGWTLARTGYTGEDGVEIMLPSPQAEELWAALWERGVAPCGLGARDTLRLEAGMNLYGQDMDESVTPLECGLKWTVDFGGDRAFVGRQALEDRLRAGIAEAQVGLILEGRGVLRAGYTVASAAGEGVVTSGTFSPTLGRAIALARVPAGAGGRCDVFIRGRKLPARVVKPPFVRNGRILVDTGTGTDKPTHTHTGTGTGTGTGTETGTGTGTGTDTNPEKAD